MAAALFLAASLPVAFASVANKAFPPAVTPGPSIEHARLMIRQFGFSGCDDFTQSLSSCGVDTSDLINPDVAEFGDASNCFCSDASGFDSAFGACVSAISSQEPESFSELGLDAVPTTICDLLAAGVAGPGTGVSDDSTASAAATGGGSGGSAVDLDNPSITQMPSDGEEACALFDALGSSCVAETPAYPTLGYLSQANCDCFIGGSYSGALYDSIYNSCLGYISSESPDAYAQITATAEVISDPCSSASDTTDLEGPSATGGSSDSSSDSDSDSSSSDDDSTTDVGSITTRLGRPGTSPSDSSPTPGNTNNPPSSQDAAGIHQPSVFGAAVIAILGAFL